MKPTQQPSIAQMKLALAKGGKVEVRPTVKDETIQRKIPEMEAAAKAFSAGEMSHEDYDKIVNKHKPVKPYEFVPRPATDEDADRALMENKKPHWRGHEDWPAGRKVGLRLDIPAYENHGVWVNSIHDEEGKGEDKRNTAYGPVSSVKNATFDAGPSKAIKVATGEQNKSPFARIKGELHHMSEDEAVAHMKKYLNHPDYAQVGMDPRRHGFFYDRKTMKPVTHAEHVVQIGPLVLAHKPTYGPRESYAEGGYVSVLERGDMSSPAYRAQLEREQALENVYPETLLVPAGRSLSAAAKKAKSLFESSKATGPLVTKPIGWNLQKSMDEMLGYTQPSPVVFSPRTAEEISRQALKKVPEKLLKNLKENAPRNIANSANDLSEIVRVYKEEQNKAKGGKVQPSVAQMKLAIANKAKFLEGSHTPMRLYHGTGADITEFNHTDGGSLGSGIYFTDSPEAASKFAERKDDQNPNVMPVYVSAKKVLDVDNMTENQVAAIKSAIPKTVEELVSLGYPPDLAESSREFIERDLNKIHSQKGFHPKSLDLAIEGAPPSVLKDIYSRAGFDALTRMSTGLIGQKPFREYLVFDPAQAKSAIGNRGTYDPESPDITMAEGGNVKPSVTQMKLALNKHGMYSPLEKAAMAVPRSKGTPAEFMAEASKQPGFRKEEVADRKISLPEQKMTKDEFLAHLKGHAAPKLIEKVIGGDEPDEDNGDTQYDEYKLPGGTNYREVLLKTPTFPEAKNRQIMELEANIRRMDPADYPPGYVQNMIDGVNKLKAEKTAMGDSFQSTHWTEDPNVLAHIRLSDRFVGDTGKFAVEGTKDRKKRFLFSTGINGTRQQAEEAAKRFEEQGYQTSINQVDGGKKLLQVEEIQSDWHQKGRKQGYYSPQQREEMKEDLRAWKLLNPGKNPEFFLAENPQYAEIRNAAPDAPFKKSWHELALKHILNHAANNGYDGIVITPGEEQAKRWENEGLRVQYDKTLPEYLNKLGKPHGAQVQMNSHRVKGSPDDYGNAVEQMGIAGIPMNQLTPEKNQQIADVADKMLHYFPITDSLRQQIKTEGLPQYQVGGIIHKAEGGNVQPSTAQMRMALAKHNPIELQKIGVNEAVNMTPKAFFSPERGTGMGMPPPGGVDLSPEPGQQLMAAPPQPAPAGLPQPTMQGGTPPGPGMAPPAGPGAPAGPTPPGGSGILQMTPQGRALSALGGQQAPGMAKGGSAKSVDEMKAELAEKSNSQDKRVTIKADGPGGVKGLVVPRHTLEGNAKSGAVGLHEMNEARAKVYGDDHRPPLTLNKIAQEHRKTLEEHFAKPLEEQHAAEKAALQRLRDAKHIGKTANTLDESEKMDTVRHERDEEGRTHVGFASKGVAGHALYTSGKGKDTKYHVINTCPGQTEGCGGGKDSEGIVDTKKGTCFAPNAESQYPGAATRRAAHAQAKHDPAMTNDWILAHTGSMRNAARMADKNNQRLLFRPNVVDETDVSSRHVIRHLNEQRKAEGKPAIIANSYGKTNELHDPENGYYVTHSNVGPKVKKGKEISENIGRDKARVRNTILAADNKGDFKNEQGNKTPPKGSYMVTDVKRGSDLSKKMERAISHAKYWTTGREEHELTPEEKAEGPEGHFNGNGKPTTPDKAHYGHTTLEGKRFDYQKQHILHPRLVQVGNNKDGTPHMIPTDSRFKDTEFLPKTRFKTKNGKEAGHILMTTPTESTSNVGHQTSFTHHVNDSHIEHAQKNNGEYEIDKPEDQIKAAGKEYAPPQSIKFYAEGGGVGGMGRHPGLSHDDFHAFPEQNYAAQRHMAMRGHDYEKPQTSSLPYHAGQKKGVAVHNKLDTMRLEMIKKAK